MKRIFQFAMLAVGSVFIITSCSTSGGKAETLDMDKVKAEIQALEDAFAAAEKAKDADGVVAYYSDDAVSYSRNEEPTKGKAAIRERIAMRLEADTTGNYNVYKVVDLYGEGNTLVEIGSWTVFTPSGTQTENGYYMSCFQKKDGKYQCVRDMNVTSSPEKK